MSNAPVTWRTRWGRLSARRAAFTIESSVCADTALSPCFGLAFLLRRIFDLLPPSHPGQLICRNAYGQR